MIKDKRDAIFESSCLFGNKFNIIDFAPKPKKEVLALSKKATRRKYSKFKIEILEDNEDVELSEQNESKINIEKEPEMVLNDTKFFEAEQLKLEINDLIKKRI